MHMKNIDFWLHARNAKEMQTSPKENTLIHGSLDITGLVLWEKPHEIHWFSTPSAPASENNFPLSRFWEKYAGWEKNIL